MDVARKRRCVFVGGLEELAGSDWPPFAVADSGDAQGGKGRSDLHMCSDLITGGHGDTIEKLK